MAAGSDCSIVRAHPHSRAGAAGPAEPVRACGQAGTDGQTDLGCFAWGSRAPDAALDVPGARDPLGTEGSCDSATSREGSRGPEWGVLPCCRHPGLDSQA